VRGHGCNPRDLGEGAGLYAKVRVELSRQIERFILARGGCAGERGRRTAPKILFVVADTAALVADLSDERLLRHRLGGTGFWKVD
jgi:hypothetical protein